MLSNKEKEMFLNKLINEIKAQKNNLEKANKIDKKYYSMNIEIEKILAISNEFKKYNINEEISQSVMVVHNGNPYITYILAIKAIINEINIKICINETMLATNMILVQIICYIMKELNIKTKLEIQRKLETTGENIIVLGDKSLYSMLLKNGVKNIKYSGKINISIYIENNELEELKQQILTYCAENFIEIEVYEANNIDEAIKEIKADNQGENILLLIKENINNKEIQGIPVKINKNILKDIEIEFVQEKII